MPRLAGRSGRTAGFRRAKAWASLAGVLLLAAACGPGTVAPAPPPGPNPFVEAGEAFDAGDYEAAANAYRRALAVTDPVIEVDREMALYRLSLIHALPESPLRDPAIARLFLNRMTSEFPGSSAVEVRSLLDLQAAIGRLESTIRSLLSAMDSLEDDRNSRAEEAIELQGQIDQLQAQIESTKGELEKLREIDLGRRGRD